MGHHSVAVVGKGNGAFVWSATGARAGQPLDEVLHEVPDWFFWLKTSKLQTVVHLFRPPIKLASDMPILRNSSDRCASDNRPLASSLNGCLWLERRRRSVESPSRSTIPPNWRSISNSAAGSKAGVPNLTAAG